jgi:hypothetical protein
LSKKIEVFSIDGGKFFAQRAVFPDKIWMSPILLARIRRISAILKQCSVNQEPLMNLLPVDVCNVSILAGD